MIYLCDKLEVKILKLGHLYYVKFRRRSKILAGQSLCWKCSFDFAGLGLNRGLEGQIKKILWEFNVVFPTFAKQDRVDTNFLFNKKLIIFSQFCGWVQPTLLKKKGIVCSVMSKGLLLKFTHILGSPSSIYVRLEASTSQNEVQIFCGFLSHLFLTDFFLTTNWPKVS